MDLMYVNRVGFLRTIGYPIYYLKTVHIEDRKKETLYMILDKVPRVYNSGGYKVRRITCDNEFQCVMDDVKDELSIEMGYTNA